MIFQRTESGMGINQELSNFKLLAVSLFLFRVKMGKTVLDSSGGKIKPCTDSLGYVKENHLDYLNGKNMQQ